MNFSKIKFQTKKIDWILFFFSLSSPCICLFITHTFFLSVKMEKEMLAIVKWTQGKDAGSYTVGIQANYIKDFDCVAFENDDYDDHQTFPVEWHNTTKMPLGGWEVFEAEVIAVAGKIETNKLFNYFYLQILIIDIDLLLIF